MKENLALLIDPNQLYEVSYTIDQSGKKHLGKQLVKGGDLTEKQIQEIIKGIDVSSMLGTGPDINERFKALAEVYLASDEPNNNTGLVDKNGKPIHRGDKLNITFGKAAHNKDGKRITYENVTVDWHYGRLQWVVTGGNLLDQYASLGPDTYVDAEYELVSKQ